MRTAHKPGSRCILVRNRVKGNSKDIPITFPDVVVDVIEQAALAVAK